MHTNTNNQIALCTTGRVHAHHAAANRPGSVAFSEVMHTKADALKFSAHARTRMRSRNITLTNEMETKLNDAVCGAARKGSKDTLVLLSNLAFIVNIPNKTVVTAMEGKSVKDNVFTNIDSTVIAD